MLSEFSALLDRSGSVTNLAGNGSGPHGQSRVRSGVALLAHHQGLVACLLKIQTDQYGELWANCINSTSEAIELMQIKL